LALLRGHSAPITVVVPSPDGTHALSGSMDRSIRLWALPKAGMPFTGPKP